MSINIYENFEGNIGNYFESLKSLSSLKKNEEKKLLREYKHTHNISARNKLIKSNLKYACKLASSFRGQGLSFSELISEANIGLIDSIDKFDIKQDVKLISYSKWWIIQRMQAAIERKNKTSETDLPEDERPMDDYICEDVFMKQENIKPHQEFETEDEKDKNAKENKELIKVLLSSLNEREKDMVDSYYGLTNGKPLTLSEIGEKYTLTKERVRKIIEYAFKKMRTTALTENMYYLSV